MAVYTEVSDEELEAFIAEYDIGEVTALKGIAEGVENSNYLLQTTCGSYILTLYEKRVDPADLPYFIGLMEHLAGKGLDCPTPLHGRDGKSLRSLCGRPAAIISFLQGMWPRRISAEHCRELGTAMARMHVAGLDFPMSRPNNLSLAGWQQLFAAEEARADEVHPGLRAKLAEELAFLATNWPAALPTGVIHADLFPDNVFFQGGHVSGLIDFYFACNDALAYDIAICINAWCFEADGQFNATKARLLLGAYQKVRPLTRAEYDALPILCRGAAMRFLLTRLYDWLNTPAGAFVKRKDPMEYRQKLRFHQQVTSPGAYGLEPA